MKCRHHWVLPEPNGPVAAGRCKLCGAMKAFSNTPVEMGSGGDFDRVFPEGQKRRRTRGRPLNVVARPSLQCEKCGQTFRVKPGLTIHVRTCEGTPRADYAACVDCGAAKYGHQRESARCRRCGNRLTHANPEAQRFATCVECGSAKPATEAPRCRSCAAKARYQAVAS